MMTKSSTHGVSEGKEKMQPSVVKMENKSEQVVPNKSLADK